MKKFLAALLLVSMVGFVGCKEESAEDKAKNGVEALKGAADDAAKDGKAAADDAAAKAKEALAK